ncbi:unnamed protein product [Orchesella dallaii]|uniref:WD repeat-containing protein 55 homolog n=1 Tax=Orchesella dallaii TaxID=48710 RepID=A0ABP1S0I7_9HEXA
MGINHDSLNGANNLIGGGDGGGEEEEEMNNDNEVDAVSSASEMGTGSSSSSDSDSSDSDSSSDDDSMSSGDAVGGGKEAKVKVKTEKPEEEEVDEEDPVIKAITRAKEKKSLNHPPDLLLETIPSTLCFHPQLDQVAFGNYQGLIQMFGYSTESNQKLVECMHKDAAVRAITFSLDGQKLVAAYSDQTLKFYDVEAGLKLERTIKNATTAPVSSLYIIDEHLLASGDDDGNVLIWDNRSQTPNTPSTSLRLGEDAITSMVTNIDKRVLVCASEEGAIYALKIRGGKVQVESEIYDYEFNCSCVFKQEAKLAVGDGKGDVYIFNWDEFGKHSDIVTGIGRGEAINAMIPITEKIILSGGDDGFIRAFNFFPQKYLGVVGKVGHPVEKMDVCNDGHLIASIGADETVKFWNVAYFESMTVGGGGGSKENGGGGEKEKPQKKEKGDKNQDLKKHNLPSSSHQNASDFFKGLAE